MEDQKPLLNGKNIYWEATPSIVAKGPINSTRWLAEWEDYSANANGICATYFLDEEYWKEFKNTEKYENYVVGAIGTPTAEMIVASYNARSTAIGDTENSTLTLTSEDVGYKINGEYSTYFSRLDKLYTSDYNIYNVEERTWLASPSCSGKRYLFAFTISGSIGRCYVNDTKQGVRPVVCLKSSTPAYVGVTANGTDIVLK